MKSQQCTVNRWIQLFSLLNVNANNSSTWQTMSYGVLKKKGECLENDSDMSVKPQSWWKVFIRDDSKCADLLVDIALGNHSCEMSIKTYQLIIQPQLFSVRKYSQVISRFYWATFYHRDSRRETPFPLQYTRVGFFEPLTEIARSYQNESWTFFCLLCDSFLLEQCETLGSRVTRCTRKEKFSWGNNSLSPAPVRLQNKDDEPVRSVSAKWKIWKLQNNFMHCCWIGW